MNSIGGYFELELRKGEEYHPGAIALNTGRNALELILRIKGYKKVYIPYFICDVILEPFKKTRIPYEFYEIDNNLEPVFNKTPGADEALLYANYFGIQDNTVRKIKKLFPKNLIVDNSQSFYSMPHEGIPTFYSCRKFFGLPDGAYLYMDDIKNPDLPSDHSGKRFSHLLKRVENGPEAGFNEFIANEKDLVGQPIKQMSRITKSLLCNIDYDFVRTRRRDNFLLLHDYLATLNELTIIPGEKSVPMVYPFLINKPGLRKQMIDKKIFIATYWQTVKNWVNENQIEFYLSKNILPLPIDQRYDHNDMLQMCNLIKSLL